MDGISYNFYFKKIENDYGNEVKIGIFLESIEPQHIEDETIIPEKKRLLFSRGMRGNGISDEKILKESLKESLVGDIERVARWLKEQEI